MWIWALLPSTCGTADDIASGTWASLSLSLLLVSEWLWWPPRSSADIATGRNERETYADSVMVQADVQCSWQPGRWTRLRQELRKKEKRQRLICCCYVLGRENKCMTYGAFSRHSRIFLIHGVRRGVSGLFCHTEYLLEATGACHCIPITFTLVTKMYTSCFDVRLSIDPFDYLANYATATNQWLIGMLLMFWEIMTNQHKTSRMRCYTLWNSNHMTYFKHNHCTTA